MRDIRDFTDKEIHELAVQRLHFEVELDHAKLVARSRPEVRRYLRVVRRALKRGNRVLDRVAIIHDDDNACCQSESWEVTNEELMKQLQGKF